MRIINTIHDSIITLVKKEDVQKYEALSKLCFTDITLHLLRTNYKFNFVAPLGCGIKVSRNWGASTAEVLYNVLPDGTTTRREKIDHG